MSVPVRILRFYFGLSAFMLLLGIGEFGYFLWLNRARLTAPNPHFSRFTWILGYLVSAGVMSGIAWWQMKRGGPWAARWALAAAVYHVFVLPFGPLVTGMGLFVFLRKSQRESMTAKRSQGHQPKAGDGTSRFSQTAFWVLQWVCFFAGFRWID